MRSRPSSPSRIVVMNQAEFARHFGNPDVSGAVCGYTPEADTHAVLRLLAHARPRRVLDVGTALGHMTANFSRWTIDDAQIFSLGLVRGMERTAPGAAEQMVDEPTRGQFARFADQFGKAWKVFFITADSMRYDFSRLAPLDFTFIDGGHDLEHALNDSRKAYDALTPGGWLVWHDFNSPVHWVKVREAIERLGFSEPVVHVEGTQVAFLRKQGQISSPKSQISRKSQISSLKSQMRSEISNIELRYQISSVRLALPERRRCCPRRGRTRRTRGRCACVGRRSGRAAFAGDRQPGALRCAAASGA